MTNEEIIQRGQLINDETEPAQNTSERVGGVIKGIGQNLADKDTAIAAEAARNGYYQCTVSGTTLAVTAPGFTLPAHGGNIRIKMSAPATGACTLNINGTGAKALLYNGAAVSSANTWEQNEIISVFYDPSGNGQYLASNSQGGGGKAEKIKYDNSQSGLAAENVQEAVDELAENFSFKKIPYNAQQNWFLMMTSGKWSATSNSYNRTLRLLQITDEKYIKVTSNNTYSAGIGFLKTFNPVNNRLADFCDGYTSVVRTEIGETKVFSIPNDCNYIIINCIYQDSGINLNYEPIYVGLSVDAQEVYDEVETINIDGLASGSLILDSIDYGYYYNNASGSKTSFQNANIDKYKINGIVSKIHLTARIGSAMYSLFKDIEGNILGSFAGASGQGMNFNQDITLPQGTAFVEISRSTTYNVYAYVLDRMVDAVIELAAPANGTLQLTSTNEGHYISSSTGTISELSTLNIDYYNIVGTVNSIHIRARIGTAAYILLYDSSNNIIGYVRGHDSSIAGINFDEDITVPSNCARIAVSYSTTVSHTVEVKKSLPEQIKEHETEIDYLKDKIIDFRGKKIGLLGDSIAANGGFITKACQMLGATFKNAAIGGWFLGNKESKAIYKQINKISPATTQLDGDEDLIVIFAGTNDFGHSFKIGEPYMTDADGHRSYNTDASTTCGGLALAIQTLYTKYDGYIPIVICTPLQRSLAGASSSGGSWDKNSINKYMDDYIDAIISVATYYGIPVCDFYHCNMNPNIPAANTLYFADGLHPNAAGHSVMGRLLANFLVNNAFTLS